VVLPVRDRDEGLIAANALPPGADEILLVEGPGVAGAKNEGARVAKGDVLLFTDDDVRIRGDLAWLKDRPGAEAWWRAELVDGTDGLAASNVDQVNAAGRMGLSIGSNGPFQALRRRVFDYVGGFHADDVFEDIGLSRRLSEAKIRLYSTPYRVVIRRPFAPFQEVARRRRAEAIEGRSGPFTVTRLRPWQVLQGRPPEF